MAEDAPLSNAGGEHPREDADGLPSSDEPVLPPGERIAVVVNGNAERVNDEVIDTLDQILSAGELFISRRVEDGRYIARTLVERGYGTVLLGGGDGTFTVMVSDIVREARRQGKEPPRFGLLRLGTGNALAWVIGASQVKRGGLQVDIDRLRGDAGSRPVRLIEVEEYLAPFCGFGIDALVLRDYNQVKNAIARGPFRHIAPGAVAYLVSTTFKSLPAFLFRPVAHVRVVNEGADAYRLGEKGAIVGRPIRKGEVIYEGRARIASVSTIPYYGFGFRCFPFAEEREDRMNLRISTIGSFTLAANFPAIWKGQYENLELLFDYLVDQVSIEADPATEFQIGGDPVGKRRRVHLRLSPEPIRLVDFYAPPRG
jgi:diacylglycerol kinase family enzyme